MSTYYGINDNNRARRSAYKHAKYYGLLTDRKRRTRHQRSETPKDTANKFGRLCFYIVLAYVGWQVVTCFM